MSKPLSPSSGSDATTADADASYPNATISRLAFGSCHSRGAFDNREWHRRRRAPTASNIDDADSSSGIVSTTTTIWDAISSLEPQAFLWTGDAVYTPKRIRGDAPVSVLREEYDEMLRNRTLGYASFLGGSSLKVGGVHGTWDDHDYGGNDRGREMTNREERRDAYLDFLGVGADDPRRKREGTYGTVDFGSGDERIKVVLLDTRWHRSRHCLPSLGSSGRIPLGAAFACVTRWITAGLDLPSLFPSLCADGEDEVLGEEQWEWLERVIEKSEASIHVVVSSIQVLTTNPTVESWGHYPAERNRLLRALDGVRGLVVLSGDVHHAEVSTTRPGGGPVHLSCEDGDCATKVSRAANDGAIVEVTSSGLTHSCQDPFYGSLCQPILNAFSAHRYRGSGGGRGGGGDAAPYYYTGRNFGILDVDWSSRTFRVDVRDESGSVVLNVGPLDIDAAARMTEHGLEHNVAKCIDGHLRPAVWTAVAVLLPFGVVWSVLAMRASARLAGRGKSKRH